MHRKPILLYSHVVLGYILYVAGTSAERPVVFPQKEGIYFIKLCCKSFEGLVKRLYA